MASFPPPAYTIRTAMADAAMGLPVLVLVLMAVLRSPADALALLLMSVVCTLGIGALLWLGLAVLIGRSLRLLWRSLSGARRPVAATVNAAPAVVSRYVEASLRQGADPQRLRRDLIRQGWSPGQLGSVLPPSGDGGAGGGAGDGGRAT